MKKILVLILTCVIMVVFTGCGDKTKNTDSSGLSEKNAEHTIVGDGELSVFSYKPDTFCPIVSVNNASLQMLNIVFEGLIYLDDEMLPQPRLAKEWKVSNDCSEWNIVLRDDVKWHTGEKLTANDVIYTINQIKNNGDSFYSYNVSHIDEVSPKGENGITIKLSVPNPNFISLLNFPIIKYSSEDIDKAGYRPVGTGPYVFEDRNEGNIYYLTKNKSWWGGDVKTEVVKVKLLPDKDTALYAFRSGSIDMTLTENVDWGKSVNEDTASLSEIKSPIYNFIGINHMNTVLAMDEVRQAISYAIDRDEIIEEVMMGFAVEANAPVREEWFICGGQEFEFKQNTKIARETLLENEWQMSKAKYRKIIDGRENRLKFDILINNDNTIRANIAKIIEKNLEEFGMDISVTKVSYDEYIERINNGKYDMFIGSYSISPDFKFDFMVGEGNIFNFKNDEMDFVLNQLKTEILPENMIQSYAEVINLFNKLNPVIGLLFENKLMVYNNEIQGDFNPSYFNVYQGIEQLSVKGINQ